MVVTKCRYAMTVKEKEETAEKIAPLKHQHLFFSTIRYGTPYHILSKQTHTLTRGAEVLLVTGIANPDPLKKMLEETGAQHHQLTFSDHHIFTIDDLRQIVRQFEALPSAAKLILTTEKDAVRLVKFEQELKDLPFYVIPIEHEFLFGEAPLFDNLVKAFIHNFKQSS